MSLPNVAQVGWYGKLPAIGDFASRRLPSAFIRDWDGWLAQSILQAREMLGTDWTQTYMDCPIWRFVLPPGVLGADQTASWAGVVMASVDRVGRQFPFTLAAPLNNDIDPFENLPALARWWAGLEDVALDALQSDLDGDGVDAELAALSSGVARSVAAPFDAAASFDPVSVDDFGLEPSPLSNIRQDSVSIDVFGLEPAENADAGLGISGLPESASLLPGFPASSTVNADAAVDLLDEGLSQGEFPAAQKHHHEPENYRATELAQAAWLGSLMPESGFATSGHSLWSVTPMQGAMPCLAVHCVAGMPDVFQFIAMLRTRPTQPRR